MTDQQKILNGIAAYKKEQQVLLRLLRFKNGKFTEKDFDRWFKNRDKPRKLRLAGITGDSFILGAGINGYNEWAMMLELMQCMMRLNMINAKKINGIVVYSLPK